MPLSSAMAPTRGAAAAPASRRRALAAPLAAAPEPTKAGGRRQARRDVVASVTGGNGAEAAATTTTAEAATAIPTGNAALDQPAAADATAATRSRRRTRRSTKAEGISPATSKVQVRHAAVSRVTKETSVDVAITIDGTGACQARSSIPFLDHMLDQLASHGLFDVSVKATGDTWIDDHHTNEDVALALGTALARALGDRRGIARFGDFSAPLDEALVHVVLDLSGRPHLSCDLKLPTERIGTYETQLVEHFFQSLVNTSGMTLHIRQLAGTNSHHIVEATFKAFARALRIACERDPRRGGSVASSKGVLTQA